jgi:hypothetical protein
MAQPLYLGGNMQVELGQIIIDTQEDLNDIGIVVEVGECNYGDPYCLIQWTCRRTYGNGNYKTTLAYSLDELEEELSRYFEVIELK